MHRPNRAPHSPAAAAGARASVAWLLVLAVALAGSAAGCIPIEETDAGDTTSDAASGSDSASDADARTWPPRLDPETDSQVAFPAGGPVSFFSGELVLTLDVDSVKSEMKIEVTRQVLSASDSDWVGYTFGDHGLPIDPRAMLQVTVPLDWVPPGGEEDETLGLYEVVGDRLSDKLPLEELRFGTGTVTFVSSLDAFKDFAIATESRAALP